MNNSVTTIIITMVIATAASTAHLPAQTCVQFGVRHVRRSARLQHSAEYAGPTYYFCSNGCRAKFVADPQKYLKSEAAKAAPVSLTITPARCTPKSARKVKGSVRSAAWLSSRCS